MVQASTAPLRLKDADFRFIAELACRRTGIQLNAGKRDLVQARLAKRVRALGLSGVSDYVKLLRSPRGEEEMTNLISALTTNVTAFFREEHHFRHLHDQVVVPWRAGGCGRLRLWSAACSTGEEPYSMALTLLKAVPDAASHGARILATDLDGVALGRARTGIYQAAAVKSAVKPSFGYAAGRHFVSAGPAEVRIGPEARDLVALGQLNLLERWPMRGPFDAIFCRNVMIYFDQPTKLSLCRRLAALLRPGGFLYIGHSETLLARDIPLRPIGGTIYRRIAGEEDA
ncbi:CheR family methyltransferase [Azospirillum picis]|uniref:Chemotaxis protein methyltransferase n=1 Tax=Azospirillum picis TaxID=488438 RepID=A0ABU0MVG3_9PROT|nr:protein-glutamate O-methyltransferase CheR [Azospirillum picis]MBP2303508.1 chemotaxis protein methyltransferase CheR [Azospirillum picis]MDQ0537411.1 chemotaxis protein methyltransferase CheR [Azospirillum picis]